MSERTPLKAVYIPIHALRLAVSFLTRFPAGNPRTDDINVWKLSLAFYPLCGYLIGIAASLPLLIISLTTQSFFNLPFIHVSVFIYVAALEWITRMLHLDGFCDCCDAFSVVSADKEKRLSIMKDPHVGASAVGGAVLLIAGKLMALNMLANMYNIIGLNGLSIVGCMISIPVFGRLSITFLAAMGKYPRENGTAMNIVGKVPFYSVIIAFASVVFLLNFIPANIFLINLLITVLCVFYWKMSSSSKIGGGTGDVLGACSETTELAVCFGFLLAASGFF
ncbi:MAG: hypothetical protein A2020_03790 [Lentisphaerae bacterium GWF2_45_14]|nr:MAG: hypothetical protein A2020_03790 [Lentisphaerae bacterium GWF2_45_14]